jgi:site-specific recombinase XerD
VLSVAQAGAVLSKPDLTMPLGLRDRAILEVLYSTGIRRMELMNLDVVDLDAERTVILESRSDEKDEARWKAIGMLEGTEIVVVYTLRSRLRRIISARRAGRDERRAYREAHPGGPSQGED